ncbi:hypothetical protein L209DRAFT_126784 [Thermothelomyces heterothallicus CBS 203.75]
MPEVCLRCLLSTSNCCMFVAQVALRPASSSHMALPREGATSPDSAQVLNVFCIEGSKGRELPHLHPQLLRC